jgi:hypothetical protein
LTIGIHDCLRLTYREVTGSQRRAYSLLVTTLGSQRNVQIFKLALPVKIDPSKAMELWMSPSSGRS